MRLVDTVLAVLVLAGSAHAQLVTGACVDVNAQGLLVSSAAACNDDCKRYESGMACQVRENYEPKISPASKLLATSEMDGHHTFNSSATDIYYHEIPGQKTQSITWPAGSGYVFFTKNGLLQMGWVQIPLNVRYCDFTSNSDAPCVMQRGEMRVHKKAEADLERIGLQAINDLSACGDKLENVRAVIQNAQKRLQEEK